MKCCVYRGLCLKEEAALSKHHSGMLSADTPGSREIIGAATSTGERQRHRGSAACPRGLRAATVTQC